MRRFEGLDHIAFLSHDSKDIRIKKRISKLNEYQQVAEEMDGLVSVVKALHLP